MKRQQLLVPTQFFLIFCLIGISFIGCEKETQNLSTQRIDLNSSIDSLIKKGISAYYDGEYLEAKKYYDEAKLGLEVSPDTVLQIGLLLGETELLMRQGNYDVSIANYYEVAKLAELIKDTLHIGLARYNLATIHYHLNKIEEAKSFNLEAQKVFKALMMEDKLVNCYIQFAVMCNAEGNFEIGKKYMEQAIDYYTLKNNTYNLAICYNNLGYVLAEEEKYQEAIEVYQKAALFSMQNNGQFGLAARLGNIGEIFLRMSKLDSAKYYLDSSMVIANRVEGKESVVLNYRRFINYFYAKEEIDSVIAYSDKLLELNTELLELESKEIVKALEDKHQNELELIEVHSELDISEENVRLAQREKVLTYWVLFFVIIISIIIIVTTYLLYQKQKKIRSQETALYEKEKQFLESENKLAALELKHKEEQQEKLENELEYKKKELMQFSLNLKEKINLVEEIKNLLDDVKLNQVPNPKTIKKVNLLLQYTANNQQLEIEKRIEEINSSFFYKLKTTYPKLSQDDIKLASLLLLNFSSKEISNVINIEPKSVDMKRYRLKKKMNLDSKVDLKVFLGSL